MMLQLILVSLLAAPTPEGPSLVAGAKLESVWDFVVKGGPTMFVLIACSLVALAVVVERLIVLRHGAVIPPAFLERLRPVWGDRARAMEACRVEPSPIARVLSAAASRRPEGLAAVERAVEDSGRREVVRLRHRMRLMGALPQVATMLGLLGTIFGMIKTFQAVATSGQALGKTELLAKGIFEAWTCTAAGLLVAIPAMVAYQVLMGRIDARVAEMDRVAEEWVHDGPGAAGAVAVTATAPAAGASPIGAV